MMTGRFWRGAVVVALALTLAACQSDAERAEEHYERAMSLLAEGDFDRARVEFLNVFQNDGQHRSARSELAAMLRELGRAEESYSQYLRLIEQYPDDMDGRYALAEMAIQFGNWDEARRHGAAAMELAADDPRAQVIAVNLAFAEAAEAGDQVGIEAALARASELLENDPDNALLLRLRITQAIEAGDYDTALVALEEVLVQEPGTRFFHDLKLSILAERNDAPGVEAQLLAMLGLFRDDENLPGTLLRFYLGTGNPDAAMGFLRDQAAQAEDDRDWVDAMTALVRLRLDLEGVEAALAELDPVIAEADTREGRPNTTFLALRSTLQFGEGETETAIAAMEALLEREDLGLTEAGELRVVLARMLLQTGNEVGARAQVEQILETDPGQAGALKMRAAWLIQEDDGDRAIAALRIALDSDPDDVEGLTLMAQAYTRNGNRELAREFLALAVEASNSAPAETLRYVEALVAEERYLRAEERLIDALRLAPGEITLSARLGELYITMEDWPRAEQVERALRRDGSADGVQIADGLQATRLAAQGRMDEAVSLVEGAAQAAGTGDEQAQMMLLRARLASGDVDGAVDLAEALTAEHPDTVSYRFALAAVYGAQGDVARAEEVFRGLTQSHPDLQQAWIGLIRTLNAQGRGADADAALDQALAVLPNGLDLLWAQASLLEQSGDIDGAIAVYERMYEAVPNSEVVANNLASLLTSYRDDAESLDRAWAVARRLRGLEVPAFQDTYGWIAYRRGDFDVALEHLEPAAAGLSGDALVQYHLAMTYLALERPEDALAQFRRVLEVAGPDDTRPQIAAAEDQITALESALADSEDASE